MLTDITATIRNVLREHGRLAEDLTVLSDTSDSFEAGLELTRQRQPDAGARRALQHRIFRAHAPAQDVREHCRDSVRPRSWFGERVTRLKEDSALLDAVQRIGRDVAGPAADSVDCEARFPREAITALREERLLSVLVPKELGGAGTIAEVGVACETLGRACSSTAMIFAMHQIQVACPGASRAALTYFQPIPRQARGAAVADCIGDHRDRHREATCAPVSWRGRTLVALPSRHTKRRRSSPTARSPTTFRAPARRGPAPPPGDQVLRCCFGNRGDYDAPRPLSTWDTLGFAGHLQLRALRSTAQGQCGTDSPGAVRRHCHQTMLPTSHVLWTSLWLGLASRRCRSCTCLCARRGTAFARNHSAGCAAPGRSGGRAGMHASHRSRGPARLRAPRGRRGRPCPAGLHDSDE